MKRNSLEWAILVISVAVVVALVGYLLVSGLANDGPAMIRAEVTAAEAAEGPGGGWLVPVTVHNEGEKAAVSIVVEGTAIVAGTEESSELTSTSSRSTAKSNWSSGSAAGRRARSRSGWWASSRRRVVA